MLVYIRSRGNKKNLTADVGWLVGGWIRSLAVWDPRSISIGFTPLLVTVLLVERLK